MLTHVFFCWDISVIFYWDKLVTETFRSFVSVGFKLVVTVFISLYYQTFWPKWLNFFRSFQKHLGLWPKKKQTHIHLCSHLHIFIFEIVGTPPPGCTYAWASNANSVCKEIRYMEWFFPSIQFLPLPILKMIASDTKFCQICLKQLFLITRESFRVVRTSLVPGSKHKLCLCYHDFVPQYAHQALKASTL